MTPGPKPYRHEFTENELRRYQIAHSISPHSILGSIGENVVVNKFLEHNIPVYTHFGFDQYVDLIAEFNGGLQRIQVKTSAQITSNGSIRFSLNAISPTTKNGYRVTKSIPYTKNEIDYFALYDFICDKVYLIEVPDPPMTSIRLCEINNGSGLSSARYLRKDFEFDTVIKSFSAIDAEYKIMED